MIIGFFQTFVRAEVRSLFAQFAYGMPKDVLGVPEPLAGWCRFDSALGHLVHYTPRLAAAELCSDFRPPAHLGLGGHAGIGKTGCRRQSAAVPAAPQRLDELHAGAHAARKQLGGNTLV